MTDYPMTVEVEQVENRWVARVHDSLGPVSGRSVKLRYGDTITLTFNPPNVAKASFTLLAINPGPVPSRVSTPTVENSLGLRWFGKPDRPALLVKHDGRDIYEISQQGMTSATIKDIEELCPTEADDVYHFFGRVSFTPSGWKRSIGVDFDPEIINKPPG